MKIYETKNFVVESHERPEVDRLDGGHVKISPKVDRCDRTELSVEELHDYVELSAVAGRALKSMMAKIGVEIGRINYQENGNWKPHLHLHLYGRAVNAKWQKYGDPIKPGHREEYQPLTAEDVKLMRTEIEKLWGGEGVK